MQDPKYEARNGKRFLHRNVIRAVPTVPGLNIFWVEELTQLPAWKAAEGFITKCLFFFSIYRSTPPHWFVRISVLEKCGKLYKKPYTMEYIFEHNFRLEACNYAQKCTPSCMIFQHFLKFLKNRSSKEPLWRGASAFIIAGIFYRLC